MPKIKSMIERIKMESVEDIISKLQNCPVDGFVGSIAALVAHRLADRLKTAYENDMKAKDDEIKRLKELLAPFKAIDLSKCSPLPWKCRSYNSDIADTGDVEGHCIVEDAEENQIAGVNDWVDWEPHEVEKDDGWTYHADMLAIAESVNAVAELQRTLNTPI